jgi:hypothetical protein
MEIQSGFSPEGNFDFIDLLAGDASLRCNLDVQPDLESALSRKFRKQLRVKIHPLLRRHISLPPRKNSSRRHTDFVALENPGQVDAAIAALNHRGLLGKRLFVAKYRKPGTAPAAPAPSASTSFSERLRWARAQEFEPTSHSDAKVR